jgi:hypothetical protein
MRMHARLGGKRQARDASGTGTGTPSSGYPHRSLAPIPVRYASVECDARSHMVSEMTDWRAEMIGGLSSG